jgi:hypothetical protein
MAVAQTTAPEGLLYFSIARFVVPAFSIYGIAHKGYKSKYTVKIL